MLAVPGPQAKSQTSQAKGGVTVFRLVGDIYGLEIKWPVSLSSFAEVSLQPLSPAVGGNSRGVRPPVCAEDLGVDDDQSP